MSEERNPYAAPSSPIESTQSSIESREPKVTARSVFLYWEKWLRPAYNLILAGVACLVILSFTNKGYPVPRNGRTVFHFISRAIAANLLFTGGPLADYYISVLLGRRSVLVTGVFFTLGTLFSMLVVPISVSWFWSTQYPGLRSFD
jgi:hypothetical protein